MNSSNKLSDLDFIKANSIAQRGSKLSNYNDSSTKFSKTN